MATSLHQTGTAVVGYFSNGQAAHQAIHALIEEGFSPSEIGAAFHTSATGGAGAAGSSSSDEGQPNVGGSLREELGTTLGDVNRHGSNTAGGASSDSSQVQYAALGGGAGTPFDGAGRPGPISGSSLAHTGLPSELKSELPHDPPMERGGASGTPAYAKYAPEPGQHIHESWTEKLKHIFGKSEPNRVEQGQTTREPLGAGHGTAGTTLTPKAPVTAESQDFGTGEGHLHLGNPAGQRYSQSAFESSFSGYGVQPEHARHLSHRISQGGAIVTVHSAARAMEAERILEAQGGEVRFSGEGAEFGTASSGDDSLVEIFGTVGRDYPGYLK